MGNRKPPANADCPLIAERAWGQAPPARGETLPPCGSDGCVLLIYAHRAAAPRHVQAMSRYRHMGALDTEGRNTRTAADLVSTQPPPVPASGMTLSRSMPPGNGRRGTYVAGVPSRHSAASYTAASLNAPRVIELPECRTAQY